MFTMTLNEKTLTGKSGEGFFLKEFITALNLHLSNLDQQMPELNV